jgi:hypothetical protein
MSPSSALQADSDPALGQAGQAVAQGVLQTGDRDIATIAKVFGIQAQGTFLIHITQTSPQGPLQGALHFIGGNDAGTEIWVNPANFDTGQIDTDFARMLALAEAVESFEFWQGQGWVPNQTNGEGLSRVLAHAVYPTLIQGARLSDAQAYLFGSPQSSTPPLVDCINDNGAGPNDGDPVRNGGAVLFLNWLASGLGFALDQIVQNGGATLAETYSNLTGRDDDAYQRFIADLRAATQNGNVVTSDNPFISRLP